MNLPNISLKDLKIQLGVFTLGPFSFDFPVGSLSLIRGANGSGKTSLLRCLLGRIRQSAGHINGLPHQIGSVGSEGLLMTSWTVEQNWNFILGLLGKKTEPLPSALSLIRSKRVSHLSLGQRRKAELLSLFSLSLPLYLLDEPFSPLDQSERHFFLNELKALKTKGVTIIMTTHDEDLLTEKPAAILELPRSIQS